MIHPLSDVQSKNIGENTRVWQYAVILQNAQIGTDCNINCHTFIENDVVIGNRVTLKSGVYLWDGTLVEDDVFIGPNASFVNDAYPRSKNYPEAFQNVVLKKNCSIGANATILGGISIGEYALIGAGAVVTKNVKPFALIIGNPGIQKGWVGIKGDKLVQKEDKWHDAHGNTYTETEGQLQLIK